MPSQHQVITWTSADLYQKRPMENMQMDFFIDDNFGEDCHWRLRLQNGGYFVPKETILTRFQLVEYSRVPL